MHSSLLSAPFSPLSVTPAVIALPPIPHSSSPPRLLASKPIITLRRSAAPLVLKKETLLASFHLSPFPFLFLKIIRVISLPRHCTDLSQACIRCVKRQRFVLVYFVFCILFSGYCSVQFQFFFSFFLVSFARSYLYSLLFFAFLFGCFARISN